MASNWIKQKSWGSEEECLGNTPAGWVAMQVQDLYVQQEIGRRYDKRSTSSAGKVPVIDQSSDGFIGWHDSDPGIRASQEDPVVTFANHTCEMRLVCRPFSVIQNVFPLRGKPDLCDTRYFYYATKGIVRLEEYKGHYPQFRERWICLPCHAEQKVIVHILGSLDDKIELNRKTNATLEAMAKALFKSWFVDFDPVRAKADGRPTGLPAEISDLFPDSFEDSELGEIPSGWEVAELGDCELEVESGKRPKGGIDKNLTSGIPSIGAESIAPVGQFDFSKTKWVPSEFAESTTKGWIRDLDVALYKDGGKPGEFRPRTALYGEGFPFDRAMVNEHVFLLRSAYLGQPFLYNLFNFDLVLSQIVHKGSAKGAQPGLNQEEVRTCSFVKPGKEVLNSFAEVLAPGIKRQLLIGKQSQALVELRDTLLPKLISGELRIPDAERLLAEAGI